MKDTIYRKDAIDAVSEGFKGIFVEYRDIAEKMIGKLPSAEPNLQSNLQPTCNQLATDCISRQDAIDACLRVRELRAYDEIEEIKALPSAESIIRCKDCKHWYSDADTVMACEFTNMSQPEDGFCNWAERKEDE